MARLRRVAMQAPDLGKSAAFYRNAFGLDRVAGAESPVGNAIMLSDGLMNLTLLHFCCTSRRAPWAGSTARAGPACVISAWSSTTRMRPRLGSRRRAENSSWISPGTIRASRPRPSSRTPTASSSTSPSTNGRSSARIRRWARAPFFRNSSSRPARAARWWSGRGPYCASTRSPAGRSATASSTTPTTTTKGSMSARAGRPT